jgi:hypothetical protein
MIQKLNLKAWSIDVKNSFSNENLEEEIYMKIPQGLQSNTKKENVSVR